MNDNIINDEATYILNNSVWFIDVVDIDAHLADAICHFVVTPENERHIDILGRQFTEYQAGNVWLRVTRAHYDEGKYIISEHNKNNRHEGDAQ
jgi:hypothetical protein